MNEWEVTELEGSVADVHGTALPDVPRRSIWIAPVVAPALVLGSTQRDDVVDHSVASSLGIEIVRRRTGGGAVLLWPSDAVWIDVILPSPDPLWVDDVGASARWLGAVWVESLRSLGLARAALFTSAACSTRLGRLICFAGTSPGEVGVDGAKVVGIAQRRTRSAARFQTMVLRRWDPATLKALLQPGLERLGDAAAGEVARVAVATVDAEPSSVVDAFLSALRTSTT